MKLPNKLHLNSIPYPLRRIELQNRKTRLVPIFDVALSLENLDEQSEPQKSNFDSFNDRFTSIDSDDSDQEQAPVTHPLRKWNSENVSSAIPKDSLKKWETAYFSNQEETPLKKWKEVQLKEIEKSLDLIEIDDERIGYTSKFSNISSESIREDEESLVDASQDTINQSTELLVKKDKTEYFKDLVFKTNEKALTSQQSKIPKLVKSKSSPGGPILKETLEAKIKCKDEIFEVDSIPLFEDEQPGEFDSDMEAKVAIQLFKRKYKV
jgi:hypothetical protein